jgi:hemoglobin/transferrin/lactoferrin receptor protein
MIGVCTVAVGADEPIEVDAITVTATRIETRLREAPATVSVISDRRIDELVIEDIKDLVRFEPGVAVRRSPSRFTAAGSSLGRDGNSGFNIRGMEGNRVLTVVDGVRLPETYSFGAQSVGRGDYVDLSVLKSVEIVRGPASALYGSDGLAGAVSFITKDPSDLLDDSRNWSASARATYDTADESFAKSVIGAARIGSLDTLLGYTRRDGEGMDTAGTNNSPNVDRSTPNPEDNKSNAVLLKGVYAINDANQLRLTWDHFDSDVDWNVLSAVAKPPLAATSTLGLRAFDETDRDMLMLSHRYDGNGAIERIDSAVYYQDSHVRQFSSEDRNTAADRIRDASFDNTIRGANLQLFSSFQTGTVQHRLVYGGDYSITRQENLRTGTVPPAGESYPSHGFPTTDQTLAGVFVQDELTFAAGKVSLYPALRWDYYELEPQTDPLFLAAIPAGQDDSEVSPKLGVVVRLTEQLNVFINAAYGFKAPSTSQVNNGFTNPVSNYRSISNPDLKPETSETIEAGLRWNGARWSGSVVAFNGEYDDFIEQIQISGNFSPANPTVFQFRNLTSAKIYGAEARVTAALGAGFDFNAAASYAHGDAKIDGVESPLPSIEPFKLTSGLQWRESADRFGGELLATYSDSKSPSQIGVSCTPSCFIPDSFVVADLVGWWKVTETITVRAAVLNVTDEKYWWWSDVRGQNTTAVTDAFSQPSRSARFSLSMRF